MTAPHRPSNRRPARSMSFRAGAIGTGRGLDRIMTVIRSGLGAAIMALILAAPAMAQRPIDPPLSAGLLSSDLILIQSGDCTPAIGTVSFCGIAPAWVPAPPMPELPDRVGYDHASGVLAFIIREELGTLDGFTIPYLQSAVLRNFAAASGTVVEMVAIYDRREDLVEAELRPTIVYSGQILGGPITMINTIVLRDLETYQLATAQSGSRYTPEHRAAHTEFLSHIRIGE